MANTSSSTTTATLCRGFKLIYSDRRERVMQDGDRPRRNFLVCSRVYGKDIEEREDFLAAHPQCLENAFLSLLLFFKMGFAQPLFPGTTRAASTRFLLSL